MCINLYRSSTPLPTNNFSGFRLLPIGRHVFLDAKFSWLPTLCILNHLARINLLWSNVGEVNDLFVLVIIHSKAKAAVTGEGEVLRDALYAVTAKRTFSAVRTLTYADQISLYSHFLSLTDIVELLFIDRSGISCFSSHSPSQGRKDSLTRPKLWERVQQTTKIWLNASTSLTPKSRH